MRPLPKRVFVMGITFEVVTDPPIVADNINDDELGAVDHFHEKIYVRTLGVTLRWQWQTLIHEVLEVIAKHAVVKADHDDYERFDSGLTGFLICNGFLDEPHRRGFYEVPDIEPTETGNYARMAEKLDGMEGDISNAKDA